MTGAKRRIGIEEALRWAYRDELPKAQAPGGRHRGPPANVTPWNTMRRVADLGAIVDESDNRWGVVPDLTATREPDPDAVVIGEAVCGLDALDLGIPDGWNPLGDLGELEGLAALAVGQGVARATLVDAEGARRLKATPRFLVVRHALLGWAPSWEADPPEIKVERHANGTPRWYVREVLQGLDGPYEVEVDGLDRKRRVPKPGAYQRRYLDPDPVDAVVSRAEYEVWRAALDVLVEGLAGRLDRFDVVASAQPLRPWEADAVVGPRLLRPVALSTGSVVEGGWVSPAEFRAGARRRA